MLFSDATSCKLGGNFMQDWILFFLKFIAEFNFAPQHHRAIKASLPTRHHRRRLPALGIGQQSNQAGRMQGR